MFKIKAQFHRPTSPNQICFVNLFQIIVIVAVTAAAAASTAASVLIIILINDTI